MKRWVVLLGLVLLASWWMNHETSVELGPGVQVFGSPRQAPIENATPFEVEGYSIEPLASFELTAKILARKRYYFGRESYLSPVDLALGWQDMSDERVLDAIDISQSGRWYYWQTDHFPVPRRNIETQSANMHMIPANDTVRRALKRVPQGAIISLKGQLVKASHEDGWNWVSSLTREDTGDGACELIWVEAFEVLRQ